MNIDPGWIAVVVTIIGFLGVLALSVGTRSPKETMVDHESRLREIESDLRGSGPLWEERHGRHEKALETLTVALNTLGEKIDTLSKSIDVKIEQVARRVDAIGTRGG